MFFSNKGRIYRGSCFAQLNIKGVQNAIRLTEPLACGVDCYIEWTLQL